MRLLTHDISAFVEPFRQIPEATANYLTRRKLICILKQGHDVVHDSDGKTRLLGKLPEHVGHAINRGSKEAHDSLERWVLTSTRMAARWNKRLGTTERLCHVLGSSMLRSKLFLKGRQISILLLFDVRIKCAPELFELGNVVWVGGVHVLEDLEHLFGLQNESV